MGVLACDDDSEGERRRWLSSGAVRPTLAPDTALESKVFCGLLNEDYL